MNSLMEARDAGLFRALTDNGAGGLSSSIGEMSRLSGGADLDLAKAPLKYEGLQPWEIFLSEAQERMSLAVPPEKVEALLALAARREVEAIGSGDFYLYRCAHCALWGAHSREPRTRLPA